MKHIGYGQGFPFAPALSGSLVRPLFVLGLALAAAAPVGAETVLHSPQDIAACLCLEQAELNLRGEMDRQQTSYDGAKSEFYQLDSAAQAQRGQVNTNDSNSITAYRQLLERRDAAEYRFKVEATPAYSAAVGRYNQAVQTYNTNCGDKAYDTEALAQVQKTLYCPK